MPVPTILDPVGDPAGTAATQICAGIIMYRVQAYNDTVTEIQRLDQYIVLLETLQVKAAAALTVGETNSVTAQATTILADVQVEMAYWQTRKEAFEIAIKFLQEEQNTLTQTKLKGSTSLTSLVAGGIQSATLVAALKAVHP